MEPLCLQVFPWMLLLKFVNTPGLFMVTMVIFGSIIDMVVPDNNSLNFNLNVWALQLAVKNIKVKITY